MNEKKERRLNLQETPEYLSEIVSGNPIPTFVIDKNHRVTHFNKACETLTGIPAGDIIGTKEQWRAFYKEERPVMADFILDGASASNIEGFYKGKYRQSKVKEGAYEAEDFFPDLGEDGKWLFFTAAPLRNVSGDVVGAVETLQDVTRVRRTSTLNEAMLRISNTLHDYPYLEDLLGYISSEIRQLLGTEGALVILHDEEADELYFPGIAYDNPETENRVREMRFSPDEIVAGKVIKTGKSLIINDAPASEKNYERDKRLGYQTKTLVQVPVHSDDRIIGVLTGINKIGGLFSQKDVDLLNTLAGTVALAIENVRFAEELRSLYREVSALNNAKDKAINHLSHELKTPVAILSDAVDLVEDELAPVPEEDWKPLVDMIYRNLKRITEIQEEVSDIMTDDAYKKAGFMMSLFEDCRDELAMIMSKTISAGKTLEQVKECLQERFFRPQEESGSIDLYTFVSGIIGHIRNVSSHRNLSFLLQGDENRVVNIPEKVLRKITTGLLKNAVENTPDGGLIVVTVKGENDRTVLTVEDFGVGIQEAFHQRIFEGFFPTQNMTTYSTGKPYDFNAGGRGADLLRMKIFSERYNFTINLESSRCIYLQDESYSCPGQISSCKKCSDTDVCKNSGGTILLIVF